MAQIVFLIALSFFLGAGMEAMKPCCFPPRHNEKRKEAGNNLIVPKDDEKFCVQFANNALTATVRWNSRATLRAMHPFIVDGEKMQYFEIVINELATYEFNIHIGLLMADNSFSIEYTNRGNVLDKDGKVIEENVGVFHKNYRIGCGLTAPIHGKHFVFFTNTGRILNNKFYEIPQNLNELYPKIYLQGENTKITAIFEGPDLEEEMAEYEEKISEKFGMQ